MDWINTTQIGDNLEILKTLPSNSINLIYCDILYGTGRDFGDYQDLKPNRDIIEAFYIPRIHEMHRLLKDTGSIYLQMDTRINHWLRCIMDDIFGYSNMRNQIIWQYEKWSNVSNCFQKNHDIIIFYAKGRNNFIELREPIEKTRKRNLVEIIDGKKVSKRINGKVIYREQTDRPISDVWVDIPRVPNTGKDVIGYKTQKPKLLFERIIKASSNEGDIVADFFCGSGTFPVAAKELGRNYFACDINPRAIEITNKRLNLSRSLFSSNGS